VLPPDGRAIASWSEASAGAFNTYVARWADSAWDVLGPPLDDDRAAGSTRGALSLYAQGLPLVAWQEAGRVEVRRYNGSPTSPPGLAERIDPVGCQLPADDDAAFPRTLTATGCYGDVATRAVAAGLIPYDLNSPLWSDGAIKRRFLALPAGETVTFNRSDPWGLPAGTTLMKEFLLERRPGDRASVFPVETRFLVKRCEPGACVSAWQGYSYRWNDAGTEGELLENLDQTLFTDWTLDSGTHRHGYPGRDECNQCHANVAGGALGLRTAQLNRAFDYSAVLADGAVENQLRALERAGMFSSALPEAPALLPRLPTPADAAFSVVDRARSYLHANCSHCHRSDGRWPVADLRFEAPLVAASETNTNICNKLVPGDAESSRLYIKTKIRDPLPAGFNGRPMPPLASLVADERQLVVTAAWINGMTTCP
jgi:hypothetical protein